MRASTAAPQGARPTPHTRTSSRPTGSRSRATTASHRGGRPLPPPRMCIRPMVRRPRATASTLRDVHPSPLPHKGLLDATVYLPVAGAAPRLNIRELRRDPHQALQTEAPSPPPASRIARLTAGSRARSAGSSKYSDRRMCATTRWSGRPGIASCGAGWSVSVAGASRAFRRARVAAPLSALEGMVVSGGWVTCARRCASRLPRKALRKSGGCRKKSLTIFRATST